MLGKRAGGTPALSSGGLRSSHLVEDLQPYIKVSKGISVDWLVRAPARTSPCPPSARERRPSGSAPSTAPGPWPLGTPRTQAPRMASNEGSITSSRTGRDTWGTAPQGPQSIPPRSHRKWSTSVACRLWSSQVTDADTLTRLGADPPSVNTHWMGHPCELVEGAVRKAV